MNATFDITYIMTNAHRLARQAQQGKHPNVKPFAKYRQAFAFALTQYWAIDRIRVDIARTCNEAGISAAALASCSSDTHRHAR